MVYERSLRPLDDESREMEMLELHVGSPPIQPIVNFVDSEDKTAHFQYILNVAVKIPDTDNDNVISQILATFCQEHCEALKDHEIRRVTFIVLRSKEFPKYFTFRARLNYKEDLVYRYFFSFLNVLFKNDNIFQTSGTRSGISTRVKQTEEL